MFFRAQEKERSMNSPIESVIGASFPAPSLKYKPKYHLEVTETEVSFGP